MRLKTIGGLFLCIAAAWVLSGWLSTGISYLRPVYLDLSIKVDGPQTVLLATSKDDQFPRISKQQVDLSNSKDWQKVHMAVAPHKVGYLRLGFRGNDRLYLRDIVFSGQPLDLMSSNQMRNIRFCNQSATGEISCLVLGGEGNIIFSPRQLPAVDTSFLWKWQIVFFVLSFLFCGWLCKYYTNTVISFLQRHYPNWLILVLFAVLFASYGAMRWYAFMPRLDTVFFVPGWPQFLLLLQEQIWALALLSGLLWCGFSVHKKWIKSICILIGSIILLTEWADSVLLWLLNDRFSPGQIGEFGKDTLFSVGPFLKSYFSLTVGKYTLLLLISWTVLCVYLWRIRQPIHIQLRQLFGVVAVLGCIWYLLPVALTAADSNQLAAWPKLWVRSKIPFKKYKLQAPDFQLTYQCEDGLNSRQNVIIVIVESLSSYMSDYFSKGKASNWTPQLDQLARKYVGFTNYRATNPYTAQSLFSIFTGIPAVYTYAAGQLYREPKFYHYTLSRIFQQAGYHTAFFTSASFVYSKDEILKHVGFDEISLNTDPFYDWKKRYTFQSVSDDVLYEHALQWIDDYNKQKPYLLILETTTTHPPYIDPISGENSLEKSVRYADKSIGEFITDLAKKHKLDNTLIVITSDHRSNTPVETVQTALFGPEAEARIPTVIIGSPLKGTQNVLATHIDLAPSLAYLTLPQACFHPYQHNIFLPGRARTSCTLFQSGITKDRLLINCQDKHAQISLVSDTNILDQEPFSQEEKDSLFGFINWIRDNGRY